MLRTQHPVKILAGGNNFEIKDFQNRIKSQNRYLKVAQKGGRHLFNFYADAGLWGRSSRGVQSKHLMVCLMSSGRLDQPISSLASHPFLQVRYQYRSPQKIQGEGSSPAHPAEQQARRGTLQGGGSRGPRAASGTFQGGRSRGGGREGKGRPKEGQLEATSDYGTMSR